MRPGERVTRRPGAVERHAPRSLPPRDLQAHGVGALERPGRTGLRRRRRPGLDDLDHHGSDEEARRPRARVPRVDGVGPLPAGVPHTRGRRTLNRGETMIVLGLILLVLGLLLKISILWTIGII